MPVIINDENIWSNLEKQIKELSYKYDIGNELLYKILKAIEEQDKIKLSKLLNPKVITIDMIKALNATTIFEIMKDVSIF
jgi:hypothetical protein